MNYSITVFMLPLNSDKSFVRNPKGFAPILVNSADILQTFCRTRVAQKRFFLTRDLVRAPEGETLQRERKNACTEER